MSSRREARESAVLILYEAEMKDVEPTQLLAERIVPGDPYTVRLVEGVTQHRERLDARIERLAQGWSIDRMPVIDLALLRLAVYELEHEPAVPLGAVIDEAVELAKRYSTDASGRFVNGVLAAAARELRGDEAAAGADAPTTSGPRTPGE